MDDLEGSEVIPDNGIFNSEIFNDEFATMKTPMDLTQISETTTDITDSRFALQPGLSLDGVEVIKEIQLKWVPILGGNLPLDKDTLQALENNVLNPNGTEHTLLQFFEQQTTYHFPTCYNLLETQTAVCNTGIVTFISAIFGIICFISVLGNFMVLLTIFKSSILHKPPSVFKASLAIADLLLSIFVIPSLLYNISTKILTDTPVYTLNSNELLQHIDLDIDEDSYDPRYADSPEWIKRIVSSATLISMTASILTLLTMSIDRLVAIRWPLYHRIHNSCSRAVVSIGCVWIVATVPAIWFNVSDKVSFELQPHTMTFGPVMHYPGHKDETEIARYDQELKGIKTIGIAYSIVCWLFPWVLTTLLTVGVGFYGWRSLRSMKSIRTYANSSVKKSNRITSASKRGLPKVKVSPRGSDSSNADSLNNVDDRATLEKVNKNDDSSQRLVKTLAILVALYTLCTLPMTILQLDVWTKGGQILGGDAFRWIWFMASFLFLFQSCLNIFIYHRSKEFSEEMAVVIFGRKARGKIFTSSTRTTQGTNRIPKYRQHRRLSVQPTLSTSDGAAASQENQVSVQPQVVQKVAVEIIEEKVLQNEKIPISGDDSGMDTISSNSSEIV